MNQRTEFETNSDWRKELYGRYQSKVMGVCLYFLKDREEARDAVQDVFLKVFRNWSAFEWKCEPMTWISAIARHECFSRLQRQKRRQAGREQYLMEEETRNHGEPGEGLVLEKVRLAKYLPLTEGRMREILHLNLEQGLNHREIAARLGISRVAITRRLTRFRKALLESQSNKMHDGKIQGKTFPIPQNRLRSRVA